MYYLLNIYKFFKKKKHTIFYQKQKETKKVKQLCYIFILANFFYVKTYLFFHFINIYKIKTSCFLMIVLVYSKIIFYV